MHPMFKSNSYKKINQMVGEQRVVRSLDFRGIPLIEIYLEKVFVSRYVEVSTYQANF